MGKRHGTKRKSQTNTVCKNSEESVAQFDNEEMTPLMNQDKDNMLKNKKLKAECSSKDSECTDIPTSVDGSSVAMETDNTDNLPNPLKCGLTTLKVLAQKVLDKYKGVNIGVNAYGHQDVSPVKNSTTQLECGSETTQPDTDSVDVVSNSRKQLTPESNGGLDLNQNKTSSTTSAQDNATGNSSSGADGFVSTSDVNLMEEEAERPVAAVSCEAKKRAEQKSEAGGTEIEDMDHKQEAALSKDGDAEKDEENCLDNCMASLEEFAGMIGDLSDSQLCNMDEDHMEGANKKEAGNGLEHQGQGDCSKEVGQSTEKSAGVSAYDIESLMMKLTADLTGINAMVTRYRREIALTKQKCLRLQKNQSFHKQNKLK